MLTSHTVASNGLGLYSKPIKARGKADKTVTFDGPTCPNCSNTMRSAQTWEGCVACGYVEYPRH